MADPNVEIFAAASVLGIGAILALVAGLSYWRLRASRFLLLALAFAVLAAQGAYLTQRSFATRGSQDWILPISLFSLVLSLLIYAAVRKG